MDKSKVLEDFFDYGKIEITHRLNINRPINHEVRVIDKGIRIGLEHKVKNFDGESFWEIQILYRDENFKTQCDLLPLNDYHIKIIHRGNMQITI